MEVVVQTKTSTVVYCASSMIKTIDRPILFSVSGGITTEILIKVLYHFDKKNAIHCIPGDHVSFLLVDGHNTSLDPCFIECINDDCHQLKVCLGVPSAASLWNFGGTFTKEWYCHKGKLLFWKYGRGMEYVIRHYDVTPLLNDEKMMAYDEDEIKQQ